VRVITQVSYVFNFKVIPASCTLEEVMPTTSTSCVRSQQWRIVAPAIRGFKGRRTT
jgi:hypothetical protein